MTDLTKDEIQKLTPEQLAEIARMGAKGIQTRQALVDRARGHRGLGSNIAEGLLVAIPGGLAILSTTIPRLLPFAVMAVAFEVGFYVAGLNRRLDALTQLLDEDINRKSPRRKDGPHDA